MGQTPGAGPDQRRRLVSLGLLSAGLLTLAPRAGTAAAAAVDAGAGLKARARELNIAALMVSRRGQLALSDGDLSKPFLMHSMRKSMLSILVGIACAKGEMKLDATLADLGVDDEPRLTEVEKRATVRDLLQARSGVYLPAAAESPPMKARRPARGSHPPGTFWYYNNWDFNALGAIYEQLTGRSVFTAFSHFLARPLEFQDFDEYEHTYYQYEKGASRFPAYALALSARDLLKVGQLMLDGGRWNGASIVPAAWVTESTRAYSRTNFEGALAGYGYLWWVASSDASEPPALPPGTFSAAGAGGHYLTIVPPLGLVVVVRVDTFDAEVKSAVYDPKVYTAFLHDVTAAMPLAP